MFRYMDAWNTLPVAGGIYDQHPALLMEWEVIMREKAAAEAEERAAQERRAANRRKK